LDGLFAPRENRTVSKVTRFEDLIAWQKARELTRDIYRVAAQRPFCRDFGFSNQIRGASNSIMSNIAEGFERWRPSEFHYFLSVAKASCAEVRSDLYVARDAEYIDEETFAALMRKAEIVSRLVGKLRAAVELQIPKNKKPSTQHPAPSTCS
jgi:four helix bundle protein